MSLTLATLLPGLFFLLLGAALLANSPIVISALKALPRSRSATWLFFGTGSAWFLYHIWHLSMADFGEFRTLLFFGFGAVAALSFRCVPDFLAVRGLAILVLLAAMPLLDAAYMEFEHPQRLLMVAGVYLCLGLAIYLGAAPYRLRDFFEWLFFRPQRARGLGGLLLAYGLVLGVTAFTY